MGTKQSVEKKEVVEGIASRGRVHQYEEIDDDELMGNQAKFKDNPNNVVGRQTHQPEQQKDQLTSNSTVLSEATSEATVGSTASSAQSTTTNSPQVNKRYHPYDEISDDKFSSSQKLAVNGKEDVKPKSKDNSKGLFGGKKIGKEKQKDAKKHPELCAYQIMDEEVSMKTTQPDQSETNSPDPLYNGIDEGEPVSGKAAINMLKKEKDKKEMDKIEINKREMNKKEISKSNDELNKYRSKPKCEVPLKVNGKDNTTGQISPVRKPKAAPRYHLYTDKSDRQLTSSQEDAHKLEKEKNYQEKNSYQKLNEDSDRNVDQNTSEACSKLTTGAPNPTLDSNLNVSHESLQETVVSKVGVNLYNKEDNQLGRYTKMGENNQNETFEDSEPVEYTNVAAFAAASNPENEKDQDNGMDVYAVPQKKKVKPRSGKPLNYIEVEFNPSAPRAEVTQPYSPTNYCNVISKDGKIILQNS